jgi:hypothetical protein
VPIKFDWESIVGNKYNRLTVLSVVGRDKNNKYIVECICECGNKIITSGTSVKLGKAKSCGCYQKEMARKAKTTHGLVYHPLHTTWMNIKQRCSNENKHDYKWYGGSDIGICEEWKDDFKNFYNWCISNGWKEGLEIDRINNEEWYSPENCQWITQQKNKECGKRRFSNYNTTGYTGITKDKKHEKYISAISYNGIKYYLGYFSDINDAVETRINKEIELFGEQRTNFHYNKD